MSAYDNSLSKKSFLPEISSMAILAQLPCGLVVLDKTGCIVWSNETALGMLGNGLMGRSWLEVIQQAFAPKADDGHEVSLVDGRRVNVSISSIDELPGELVMLTDMTTTRDYEQSKADQRRLAAIGRMTAQLAHQIRTPLSSAILYTEHLLKADLPDSRLLLWLERVRECHTSIEQQIQDLLIFARGGSVEKQDVDLVKWSEQLKIRISMLLEVNQVEQQFIAKSSRKSALIHSESLTGAILNLINNALQAEASQISFSLSDKEECLELTVCDNGNGMSEEVRAQAGTPFYTTKARGTGLGLAVVEAVVKAHGGEMLIDSTAGMGCIVTIRIPVELRDDFPNERNTI